MKYDLDYFITKFSAIPECDWLEGSLQGDEPECKCALGHCNVTDLDRITQEEAIALIKIFGGKYASECDVVYDVNDGNSSRYKGNNPKERILNRLNELKDASRN